ncbi:Uncharacterised protein [Chlamydia trachomatis]|nr:Uncharacterised protein [Chlamydia trachomatis]
MISLKRSIPAKTAIPWIGSPTEVSTDPNVIIPPPGTPALPTAENVAVTTKRSKLVKERGQLYA